MVTCKSNVNMVFAHYHYHRGFIFHMPIGIGGDMTPFDFLFTMSKSKVTRVTFVKKDVNMVFALGNCLSQSFYIPHADWSW